MAAIASVLGKVFTVFKRPWVALGYVVLPAVSSDPTTSPTISAGSAAPAESEPAGSLYLRTDGSLYQRTASGWSQAAANHIDRWVWMDDLFGGPATEAEGDKILNSGADAQAIDPAIDTAQAGGVWQLVTGDADGTTANDGSQIVWGDMPIQLDSMGGTIAIECRLRIKTAITDVSVFFGLTDSTSLEEPFTNSADTITSTATDAVGVLYDTDATTDQWWLVAVDSDTDDTGNGATGDVPVADTWQVWRLEISSDGATVNAFVDGAATATATLSGAAGVGDDVVLYPTVIACATTTTSKTVDVDYIRIEGLR